MGGRRDHPTWFREPYRKAGGARSRRKGRREHFRESLDIFFSPCA
jgi:hypothetical protein